MASIWDLIGNTMAQRNKSGPGCRMHWTGFIRDDTPSCSSDVGLALLVHAKANLGTTTWRAQIADIGVLLGVVGLSYLRPHICTHIEKVEQLGCAIATICPTHGLSIDDMGPIQIGRRPCCLS